MSDIPKEPCRVCGDEFWNYAFQCKNGHVRWTLMLEYFSPEHGLMMDVANQVRIKRISDGMIFAPSVPVDGPCILEPIDPATRLRFPENEPVKVLGLVWFNHWTNETIPAKEFPPINGKRMTASIPNPNDPRDLYIFEERQKGVAWKLIVKKVNETANWESFVHDTERGRIDAARKAAIRYCDRHEKGMPSRDHKRSRHD